jgi:hypothetical protein
MRHFINERRTIEQLDMLEYVFVIKITYFLNLSLGKGIPASCRLRPDTCLAQGHLMCRGQDKGC